MKSINSVASLISICCKRSSSFLFSFLILLLFLLSINCNHSTPPNNDNTSITITAEDASCIEAWLNVKLNNITLPQQFNLFENDSLKTNLILLSNDTTIFVEGLLPKKNYRYKLIYTKTGGEEKSSNEITVETMDTTSHNFTWQTFTFGQHISSVLYDVAIINENNIWAVGEIYMNDSLGNPDPHAYNAVHWDGQKWELKRLLYKGGTWVIRTIFAINENDIWFSGYMRYKDGQFSELEIPDILMGWSINKLWGSSSNDLYAVGNGGNIAHWDGVKWKKIESPEWTSGTDINIRDIWGGKTYKDTYEIFFVASKFPQSRTFYIGEIFNQTVNTISISNLQEVNPKQSIYSINGLKYYTVGSSIHSKLFIRTENDWKKEKFSLNLLERVRGTNYNNIFATGHFGEIFHFDGKEWRSFITKSGITNGYFTGLDVKEQIAVFCGYNGKAVITICKN